MLISDFLRAELDCKGRSLWTTRPLISTHAGPRMARIDGQDRVVLCSNDYLGLATDPRVVGAARDALSEYGFGMRAARSLGGDSVVHRELETELASFKGVEAVLLFSSGNACNAGVIQALMREGDLVLSDQLNHASIVDGCRLSPATVRRYPHRDTAELEQQLRDAPRTSKTLIVTDSVFSMEGETAPLHDMTRLAENYGAFMMVDDAHATGVLGPRGEGSLVTEDAHLKVDVLMGTLGKALGSIGGFVGGSCDLVDYLAREARTFLFTTSLPASAAAAALAALKILRAEPERVERLRESTRQFREGLTSLGYSVKSGESAITPVLFHGPDTAARVAAALFDRGIVVQAIGPPYVPAGGSRLRTLISAAHTESDITAAVDAFEIVQAKAGLS